MRTTTKKWDETTRAEHALQMKQARINKTQRPNGVSQKKARLRVRRGGQ